MAGGVQNTKTRGETLLVSCVMYPHHTQTHLGTTGQASVLKLAVYGFDETDNETPGHILGLSQTNNFLVS